MTKPNKFVKNLKNINNSINSLLEQNLNKLKFDNLKIIASNNKIILSVVALLLLFISYLSLPTLYDQSDISKELKKELSSKFNLDFTFTQKLEYNFFPRPHFVSNGSSIVENQKNIAEINKIKIYVSLNDLFPLNKLKINEVILENTNFELNDKNFNFFIKILKNNFLNATLKIKNSNVFFKKSDNEVLFINKIKNLKYYYDTKKFKNIIYAENEIFNTPYSLEAINFNDEKKFHTKLNIDFAKLEIKTIHNYGDKFKSGSSEILLNKKKNYITYKTAKNFFEFDYYDDLDNYKFLYNGKININPFFSSLKGSADEINISNLFGTNSMIVELLKTEIFNNKNIEFKLNVNADKIKNNQNFINLVLNSKIQEGLIDVDNTTIEWKDNSSIKLTDTLILVKDGKLYLDGKSEINIINFQNIYKFLLTPKKYRKKINKIDFSFSYAFNEKTIIVNDIIIDGKYSQKVNKKLNNFYFRESNLQNKIYIKNMINEIIKAHAG